MLRLQEQVVPSVHTLHFVMHGMDVVAKWLKILDDG